MRYYHSSFNLVVSPSTEVTRITLFQKVQTHFLHLVRLEAFSSHLKIQCNSHKIIFFCSYTGPNHLSALVFAAISIDTVEPSIVINSPALYQSINFTPHKALNISLSVLLKIATSLSFRGHVCFHIVWQKVHSSDKLFPLVVILR